MMHTICYRTPRALLAFLALTFLLSCGKEPPPAATTPNSQPTAAATPADAPAAATAQDPQTAAQDAQDEKDDEERALVIKKWTGDLDGMIERRRIRVLTTYSKTFFFIDKGTQMGITVDAFKLFEDDLNKELKTKNIRVLS